jgi:hypothetical protein
MGTWMMGVEIIFHKLWIDSALFKASVSFFVKGRRALLNYRGNGLIKIDIQATVELLRTMSEDGIYMGDMVSGYLWL